MRHLCVPLAAGAAKRFVVEKLEAIGTAFIDVGMGLEFDEGSLGGTLRVTASTPEKRDHSLSSAALTTSMRPTEPRRSNCVPRWNRRGTQIERPPRPPEHRLMQLVAAIHPSPRSSRYTSSPTISKRCRQVASRTSVEATLAGPSGWRRCRNTRCASFGGYALANKKPASLASATGHSGLESSHLIFPRKTLVQGKPRLVRSDADPWAGGLGIRAGVPDRTVSGNAGYLVGHRDGGAAKSRRHCVIGSPIPTRTSKT